MFLLPDRIDGNNLFIFPHNEYQIGRFERDLHDSIPVFKQLHLHYDFHLVQVYTYEHTWRETQEEVTIVKGTKWYCSYGSIF